jgi:ketosteroid isomerase-like protein
MSEAREILDRAIRLWNDHGNRNWVDLFSDDAKLTAPGFEGSGSEAVRRSYSLWQDAFPDCNARIKSTYVDGDTVIQQAIFEGTHTGTLNAPEQAPLDCHQQEGILPIRQHLHGAKR